MPRPRAQPFQFRCGAQSCQGLGSPSLAHPIGDQAGKAAGVLFQSLPEQGFKPMLACHAQHLVPCRVIERIKSCSIDRPFNRDQVEQQQRMGLHAIVHGRSMQQIG